MNTRKEYQIARENADEHIIRTLIRNGYITDRADYWKSTGRSPQWEIRQGRAPTSLQECVIGVLEALVLQGGIIAWDGDGASCVAQMVWAQHQRAERAEAELAELRARIDPNKTA